MHSPAQSAAPDPALRLRSHARPRDHVWIGPEVPAFVPLEAAGNTTLDLLDRTDDGGWIATYRERFDTCGVGEGDKNCTAIVRIYDCNGLVTSETTLNAFMSSTKHLEVQDVRYAGGTVYFNEACQSYSREAGGKCSSLVAVDPVAKKTLWRTAPLSSNNEFVVLGDYIVTAYGFTGEPASIRVVRRRDGAVVDQHMLGRTNFEMRVHGDVLSVAVYYDVGNANFRMTGWSGPAPKLVRLPNTPA